MSAIITKSTTTQTAWQTVTITYSVDWNKISGMITRQSHCGNLIDCIFQSVEFSKMTLQWVQHTPRK